MRDDSTGGGAALAPARAAAGGIASESERRYLLRIFNWMALGVGFTAAVTLAVGASPGLSALARVAFLPGFLGILALGLLAPRLIARRSLGAAQAVFWTYAGLWGFVLAPAMQHYLASDPALVARAFGITSAAFAGVSLYGYSTRRDLSALGVFCSMAAVGLVIALLINLFVGSGGFGLLLSVGVVGVFSGLTAWEVQGLRRSHVEGEDEDLAARKSILGALHLYGNFVVMFIHVLNILAHMRRLAPPGGPARRARPERRGRPARRGSPARRGRPRSRARRGRRRAPGPGGPGPPGGAAPSSSSPGTSTRCAAAWPRCCGRPRRRARACSACRRRARATRTSRSPSWRRRASPTRR